MLWLVPVVGYKEYTFCRIHSTYILIPGGVGLADNKSTATRVAEISVLAASLRHRAPAAWSHLVQRKSSDQLGGCDCSSKAGTGVPALQTSSFLGPYAQHPLPRQGRSCCGRGVCPPCLGRNVDKTLLIASCKSDVDTSTFISHPGNNIHSHQTWRRGKDIQQSFCSTSLTKELVKIKEWLLFREVRALSLPETKHKIAPARRR